MDTFKTTLHKTSRHSRHPMLGLVTLTQTEFQKGSFNRVPQSLGTGNP